MTKKTVLLLIGILLLIVLIVVSFRAFVGKNNTSSQSLSAQQNLPPIDPSWKVYNDDKYGFSFGHPKEWSLQEKESSIELKKGSSSVQMEYLTNAEELTVPEYVHALTKRDVNNANVKLGNTFAIKLEGTTNKDVTYYVQVFDVIVLSILTHPSDDKDIQKILDTFALTPRQ